MESANVGDVVNSETRVAQVVDWGRLEYGEAWQRQRVLLKQRQDGLVPDTLVLVEHPEVVTLGRGSHTENLLTMDGVPTFEIERGGDVTYHGPGQLVGYPVVLLRQDERDLHRYLRNLEEGLMAAAASLGITCARNEGYTGAWTQGPPQRKLASIGIACKRWVTMHGFALNVHTNLERFAMINPCGLQAEVMTSLSQESGRCVSMQEAKDAVVTHLMTSLNRQRVGPGAP